MYVIQYFNTKVYKKGFVELRIGHVSPRLLSFTKNTVQASSFQVKWHDLKVLYNPVPTLSPLLPPPRPVSAVPFGHHALSEP